MRKWMKAGAVMAGLCLAVILSGCVKVSTGVDVDVTQTQATQPGTSAEDVPVECTLRAIDIGAAGDDFTLVPGAAGVGLVISLLGQSGELPERCRQSHLPAWETVSGACTILGTGYTATISAPTGATVGSACVVRARVEGKTSNDLRFTVVAS